MKVKSLRGKVAVVTGASRGIGRNIALALAENKCHLALAARSEKEIAGLAEEINGRFDKVKVFPQVTDVRDEGMVINLFQNIYEEFGRIDFLINDAGYTEVVGLLEMTLSSWRQIVETNLTGVFLCTREAVRYMKKKGGKIVNIASTAGQTPRPGWSAYAASKAGVINFSMTMAEELKEYGIKVFCLAPGRTATQLRSILAPDEDQSQILQPEQVADTVIFFLSEEGSYIEGQPITIRKLM
jgi:NAD(P)-dependent dehydrogenase (short-subunit alcohol dehydrogenase family)